MPIDSTTLAIITGGSSGIGREVCFRLAALGAQILVVDLNENGAKQTIERMPQPEKHAFFKCDLSDLKQLGAMFEFSIQRFGRCFDILFNNAGLPERGFSFADEADDMNWVKIVDVNLTAVLYGTKLGIAYLKKENKGGYIINTASMGGILPMIGTPVYAATKAGVVHMTASLADMENVGIRVTAICPTFTETPLIHVEGEHVVEAMRNAIGSIMPVEFVADSVVQLCQDDAPSGSVMRIYMRKNVPTRDFYSTKTIPVFKKASL